MDKRMKINSNCLFHNQKLIINKVLKGVKSLAFSHQFLIETFVIKESWLCQKPKETILPISPNMSRVNVTCPNHSDLF